MAEINAAVSTKRQSEIFLRAGLDSEIAKQARRANQLATAAAGPLML
jgi:hypothetical protein